MQTCITELSHLGLLRFSGEDAQTFLQGQITINLNDLTLTSSLLAAHCNLKGRIHSLFRIFLSQDEDGNAIYTLIMPLAIIENALTAFKKYAVFSKVLIENLSTQYKIMGVSGENLSELFLNELTSEDNKKISLLKTNQTITDFSPHTFNMACRIAGLNPRLEMIGSVNYIDEWLKKIRPICRVISLNEWEVADIRAGIPAILLQTQDKFLPHHINLVELHGVSFNKGCYLGQEIIARMHYRGNIKKHMVHAYIEHTENCPIAGEEIYIANENIQGSQGTVVRVAASELGYEMLIIVEDNYADLKGAHLGALDGPQINRIG